MSKVYYDAIQACPDTLGEVLTLINKYQDKIVSVTQSGDVYTIFCERHGNVKDGDNE